MGVRKIPVNTIRKYSFERKYKGRKVKIVIVILKMIVFFLLISKPPSLRSNSFIVGVYSNS